MALAVLAIASRSQADPQTRGRFQLTPVLTGLDQPTKVAFAPNGHIFVAEKEGRVLEFRSFADHHPRVVIDVSQRVDSYWDRGLLSLAVDPDFARGKPYVYLLYSLDAPPGQVPPVWHDTCPNPPGGMVDGCVDTGVLSRFRVTSRGTGAEQVLISDRWCHQFTSHDVGDVVFGPGRSLYVSAGEGSNWAGLDYGQYGGSADSPTPKNPCGDPPAGKGGDLTPPTSQGGALRAQDLFSQDDPTSYDGTVIRVSPDSGRAWPGNPLAGTKTPTAAKTSDDDAVVAFGLRNPYRITFQPGTNDLYIADAGWDRFEEIDHLPYGKERNFGWPCYEGAQKQPVYAAAGLAICQSLYHGQLGYTSTPLTAPFIAYPHSNPPGTACDGKGTVPSGVAFYTGKIYPARFQGALFFTDYSARCLFAIRRYKGSLGRIGQVELVAANIPAVDLERGPGGDLYAVDIEQGQVDRLQYFRGDRPPIAHAKATPDAGAVPLTTTLSARASRDADGGPLSYRWSFGDGHSGSGIAVKHRYTRAGSYTAVVSVRDKQGRSSQAVVVVHAGNTPPQVFIDTPGMGYHFHANEYLMYSGHAVDREDGPLQASSLSWTFILHHCVTQTRCHVHYLETRPGTDQGGTTVPDHEWPNYLEIRLTATDSKGAQTTVIRNLYPATGVIDAASQPQGVRLAVGAEAQATPFAYTADAQGSVPVAAPSSATVGGKQYLFVSWSDGGARTHLVTVKDGHQPLVAVYRLK